MKKLNNPALNEANKAFIYAEKLESYVGDRTISSTCMAHNAVRMVDDAYFDLSPEDMHDGLKHGHDNLKRCLSGYMKAKRYFNKALLPVMVQAVHDDGDFTYKFINTLHEHLPQEELVDVIGVALKLEFRQKVGQNPC
ncbi:MAG: hypothetical protein JXB38_14640, partial [Anaerolineales bacterium]|nr:hypothetical protein [Anaerolineales bacterium]